MFYHQGYGLMMLEQQKVSPNGFLFTRGPGNYKIPGFGDVPGEFNVSLLKGSVNNRAVYSSKVSSTPNYSEKITLKMISEINILVTIQGIEYMKAGKHSEC